MDSPGVFGLPIFLISFLIPICVSIYILRMLDNAAKLRKADVKIFTVDFFSLIFMIQIPFVFLRSELENQGAVITLVVLSLVMILIWLTTIRTVSQAGIQTNGWRSLISIIVIPSTYIGAFAFCACFLNQQFAWAVGCLVALTVSLFITRAAIRSVSRTNSAQTVQIYD